MSDDEAGTPVLYNDEDELDVKDDFKFEDAGELDLSHAQDELLLTRVPKFMWEALANLGDDDEIQVGTLRVEGDQRNPSKVSMMLDSKLDAFRLVPREYNLRAVNKSSTNTFVFTEKDTYKRKGASQAQPAVKKEGNARARGARMPGYKRAVPKKTTLTGHAKGEFHCLPVENQEYISILSRRHAEKPKTDSAPHFVEKVAMSDVLNAGGIGDSNAFSGFIRNGPPRNNRQQVKATRLPENELLDLLFACFGQFRYWHMRDLRAKTQQPEIYIRATIDRIAEMVKSGPYANTWRLRPGVDFGQGKLDGALESIAPTAAGPPPPDEFEDEDGNVKMEDV